LPLPAVTDVFDFARFSYDNVIAEDGHVVAVFNIGANGTDAIIKIARMKKLRSFDSQRGPPKCPNWRDNRPNCAVV
jgi:hypothetical protein